MGHIKEPLGIDFVVDSTPLTAVDKKIISKVIANYRLTGQKYYENKSSIKKIKTPFKPMLSI